ncbi:MAG: hypothetical protein AAGA77_02875 [Bacteroidota bacterium]
MVNLYSNPLICGPAENVQFTKYRSMVLEGMRDHNTIAMNNGLDSLFEILGTSNFLSQKSEVAKFLESLIEDDINLIDRANYEGQKPPKEAIAALLKTSDRKCFRLLQLMNAMDGRLLTIIGNEDAGIGRATHLRCRYIGDLLIMAKMDRTLEEYWKDHELNKDQKLTNYYSSNCSTE